MHNLLNHYELTLNILNNNLENAIKIYEEKLQLLINNSESLGELKKFLYSMNIFVYTYMFINTSISMEKLCYNNLQLIDNSYSKEELISLGKKFIKSYTKDPKDVITKPQNEIIKNALFYIHSNLEKNITLEEVASHVHISRTYLCYLFKESTGYKFCEYVNIAKINLAKELLDKTTFNLEVISYKCGFKTQSHFSTTFKKHEKITPNNYRKKSRLLVPRSLIPYQ